MPSTGKHWCTHMRCVIPKAHLKERGLWSNTSGTGILCVCRSDGRDASDRKPQLWLWFYEEVLDQCEHDTACLLLRDQHNIPAFLSRQL